MTTPVVRTRGEGLRRGAAVSALGVAVLTGCSVAGPGGPPSAGPAVPAPTVSSSTPSPTPSGATAGDRRLVASATVLDDGSGPELCLGAIATSYPPQCGGPPVKGWTWPTVGTERANGVTWGSFFVVGTYDRRRFTAERTITAEQAAASIPGEPEPDFASPCPEPAGGWRAPDPDRSTAEDQEEVFALAEQLPGYGGSWVDDRGDEAQDPLTTVVNVQVTGDVADAERQLRTVWGGPLCVSATAHTEAELMVVLEKVSDRSDVLTGSLTDGHVEVDVVHDDGTLQRELDDRYGAGLVVVRSALRPYLG